MTGNLRMVRQKTAAPIGQILRHRGTTSGRSVSILENRGFIGYHSQSVTTLSFLEIRSGEISYVEGIFESLRRLRAERLQRLGAEHNDACHSLLPIACRR